jgi:hypothetical protein
VGAAGSLGLRNDEAELYDDILQYIFTRENTPFLKKEMPDGTK